MHSTLSPSKAARRIQCPGSLRLESFFPEEHSEYAQEGILAHEYCEHVILGNECCPPLVSDEMNRYCNVYIDYINGLTSQNGSTFMVEQTITMQRVHESMFGTVDCVVMKKNAIHVIDFKYGYTPVEVKENWQLICYAIGVMNDNPDTEYYLTIVQPRAYHKDGSIRHWRVTHNQLLKYIDILKENSELALSPNAPLKAGGHCKYCKARSVCEEFSKNAIQTAKQSTSKQAFESIGHELKYLRNSAKILDDRITVLTAEIISKLKEGGKVPCFDLRQGMSRRKWAIDKEAVLQIGEDNGIDLTTAVTPAEAEKLGLDRSIVDDLTLRDNGPYRLEEL